MERLLDKFILLCSCILLNYAFSFTFYSILPILFVICISGYRYLYEKRPENYIWLLLYSILSIRYIEFTYYLPILLYDWYRHKDIQPLYVLFIIPLIFSMVSYNKSALLVLFLYMPAIILKLKADNAEQLQRKYVLQRDSTKELNILMAQKNQELVIRQNQEIHIATLHERNRIARDIHDTVGHLLSSALLQTGAIQAINSQDALKEPIANIKNTLTTGLDSIRKSVHDMHKESIDLEAEIQKLTQAAANCRISFVYDIAGEIPTAYHFHILAIIKEALHNIMKHSNADQAMLLLREQPVFYQLIIHDNGTDIQMSDSGIGLENMRQRVEDMHGYFNCKQQDGFEIFITLPKEDNI